MNRYFKNIGSIIIILLLANPLAGNCLGAIPKAGEKKVAIPKAKAPKPYYDCDFYSYFPKDYTILSQKDSLQLYDYAQSVKIPFQSSSDPEDHKRYFEKLTNFLPRIWNEADSNWYDKLITEKQSKARFKSLNWVDFSAIFNSDAIIVGKVIDKEHHIDTHQCFYYKTTLYVKIKEVINASFGLNKDDIVMIKYSTGYMGGCSKDPLLYMTSNVGKDYSIGESNVFLLQHFKYKSWFVKIRQDKRKRARFVDQFCPNAFTIPINNYKYDLSNSSRMKDIKLFFEEKDRLMEMLFPPIKKGEVQSIPIPSDTN